jgi:hypothetical protein
MEGNQGVLLPVLKALRMRHLRNMGADTAAQAVVQVPLTAGIEEAV